MLFQVCHNLWVRSLGPLDKCSMWFSVKIKSLSQSFFCLDNLLAVPHLPSPETPDPVTRKTGSIWVKPPLLLQHHSQSVTTSNQSKQRANRANSEIRVVSRASKMGEPDLSWWKASNLGKLVWELVRYEGGLSTSGRASLSHAWPWWLQTFSHLCLLVPPLQVKWTGPSFQTLWFLSSLFCTCSFGRDF